MKRLFFLTLALTLLCSETARAYKLEIGEDSNLNIDLLLQVQAQAIQGGAPGGENWGKEFLVRRMRFLFFGEIMKNVSFFVETDMPNWGKGGDWSGTSFFVQDAYLSLKVVEALIVDAGMIIVPFTRHGMQSAVSLQALDYHSDLIRYPEGSHKVWRDFGVQLRGYFLRKRLQYRFGVFNGSQNVSLQYEADASGKEVPVKDADGNLVAASGPRDYPRITGHVRWSFLGQEPDFFPKGIYFATQPILSAGFGVDFQPDAALRREAVLEDGLDGRVVRTPADLEKYLGIAGDVFLDLPLRHDQELVFQAAMLRYWHGPSSASSGLGFLGEVGFRWRYLGPVIGADYFRNDRGSAPISDVLALHYGLNWWIKAHTANLKLEVLTRKQGDLGLADWNTTVFLQGQIFL